MRSELNASGTSIYSHRGTRAIQRLVEYAPSTGSLALWVRHQDTDDEQNPLIAANDGSTIYYGAAFERLTLPRQTGLVAHEVLHVALRHAPRYRQLRQLIGDVDAELYNICADAIVNSALSHLSWLELGDGVLLEDLLADALQIRQGVDKSLLEWDLERLYRAMDDRRPPKRQARGTGKRPSEVGKGTKHAAERSMPQNRNGEAADAMQRYDGPRAAKARLLGRSSHRDLLPDAEATRPEIEAQHAREWRERMVRGHAGDGLHSMLRALLADLPKVRTPWEQYLRTLLAHGLSMQRSMSWSRPSRSYIANRGRVGGTKRMPWEPGFSSVKAVARLAVMVDVSGSIDQHLLDRFSREIEAITRRMEAATLVVIGDYLVRKVDVFEPGRSNLREIRFQGGGGTDFSPLLSEAERWNPDIAVFLTDLEGPAAHRPFFPLIWAVPRAHAETPHPFGRKLVLD